MKYINKLSHFLKSSFNTVTSILFDKLPTFIGVLAAIALVIAPAVFLTLAIMSKPGPKDFTVKITNLAGNSGGSGVVVDSSNSKSHVLTNAHVCEVLKNGGKVTPEQGDSHLAVDYIQSKNHDLCLITVAANLGEPANIATTNTNLYDEVTVTGHPSLLPNILSKGHVTGRQIIQILEGFKPCTEDDFKRLGLICAVYGKPVVIDRESQVLSAFIMPGSSGSAVLNKDGEVIGLVFAGMGRGLSYAFTVPLEFVRNFLDKEIKERDERSKPGNSADAQQEQEKTKTQQESLYKICKDPKTTDEVKSICQLIENDMLMRPDSNVR